MPLWKRHLHPRPITSLHPNPDGVVAHEQEVTATLAAVSEVENGRDGALDDYGKDEYKKGERL